MPLYFFNLKDHPDARDHEGEELSDVAAAHARSIEYAIGMAAVSVSENRRLNLHDQIEVADEHGNTLFRVEFGDVVAVED